MMRQVRNTTEETAQSAAQSRSVCSVMGFGESGISSDKRCCGKDVMGLRLRKSVWMTLVVPAQWPPNFHPPARPKRMQNMTSQGYYSSYTRTRFILHLANMQKLLLTSITAMFCSRPGPLILSRPVSSLQSNAQSLDIVVLPSFCEWAKTDLFVTLKVVRWGCVQSPLLICETNLDASSKWCLLMM